MQCVHVCVSAGAGEDWQCSKCSCAGVGARARCKTHVQPKMCRVPGL